MAPKTWVGADVIVVERVRLSRVRRAWQVDEQPAWKEVVMQAECW